MKIYKVLVTGGAGFIGSHLVDKLIKLGYRVYVIDDLSNGSLDNVCKAAKFCQIDISDYHNWVHPKFDAIFHFACFPRSMSFRNPQRDIEVNIRGMVNVLEFARKTNTKVIFSSNSGIYGTSEKLPIDESYSDKPSTPYDIDKLTAEYYLKLYHEVYKLPITIFRFGTVYGTRQKTTLEWQPVIATFISQMKNKRTPTVYWDGEQTRDFIYVSDVVNALVKSLATNTGIEPIILSSNTEVSINKVYSLIASVLEFKRQPIRKPKKIGDVRRMWYDNLKARTVLNWIPQISLEQGILKIIKDDKLI